MSHHGNVALPHCGKLTTMLWGINKLKTQLINSNILSPELGLTSSHCFYFVTPNWLLHILENFSNLSLVKYLRIGSNDLIVRTSCCLILWIVPWALNPWSNYLLYVSILSIRLNVHVFFLSPFLILKTNSLSKQVSE